MNFQPSDSALLPVIEAGQGSARDILDGIVSVVLKLKQQQRLKCRSTRQNINKEQKYENRIDD